MDDPHFQTPTPNPKAKQTRGHRRRSSEPFTSTPPPTQPTGALSSVIQVPGSSNQVPSTVNPTGSRSVEIQSFSPLPSDFPLLQRSVLPLEATTPLHIDEISMNETMVGARTEEEALNFDLKIKSPKGNIFPNLVQAIEDSIIFMVSFSVGISVILFFDTHL